MREILSDLVAEQQQLDQFLQTLRDRQWSTKTPAEGWTIQDTVSHLAYTEALAAEVIDQGDARLKQERIEDLNEWTARGVALGRGRRHQGFEGATKCCSVFPKCARNLARIKAPWLQAWHCN